jgi:hypothetical protein
MNYPHSNKSRALERRRVLSLLGEKSRFERFSSKSVIDGGETTCYISVDRAW